jgi:hypothetical protein
MADEWQDFQEECFNRAAESLDQLGERLAVEYAHVPDELRNPFIRARTRLDKLGELFSNEMALRVMGRQCVEMLIDATDEIAEGVFGLLNDLDPPDKVSMQSPGPPDGGSLLPPDPPQQ